ncbi:MAG: dicarboxylate/amino acid:cation symporter [Oligoflexales bacterium]|nr:dicarboxylate/amino acid:cation symporter [Oligoflexales bacterium]
MFGFISKPLLMLISMVLGLAAGFADLNWCYSLATVLADLFMNMFKAVSLPIIFLSLLSAVSGLSDLGQVRKLGIRVLALSLGTTFASSCVSLSIYLLLRPAIKTGTDLVTVGPASFDSYFSNLKKIFPDNFLRPFIEGNSIAVVITALLMGLAALTLAGEQRKTLHEFFSSFLALFMKIVTGITLALPIGVWAFSCLFMRDLRAGSSLQSLALYLVAIVMANLVQAFFVLPLLLRRHRIPVLESVRGMWPALSLAFFSKSSCAAMPLAMTCAEKELSVSRRISGFSFPLCTSVNMNACAGFILITFLFVSESHGVVFSNLELMQWTVISTIVAMGHAGVPMGCFFLASALVAQANLPLTLMGIILPFYTWLDMLESAINLWSDSCVTLVLSKTSQKI